MPHPPEFAMCVTQWYVENTMDTVMSIINFIRSTSSLPHILLCKLLANMSAEHFDLLLHSDAHWVSRLNGLKMCPPEQYS